MFYKPKKAALGLISTKDYFNLIGLHESEPIIYGLLAMYSKQKNKWIIF